MELPVDRALPGMILLFISSYFNLLTKSPEVNACLFPVRSDKLKCQVIIGILGLMIFIKHKKKI